MSFILDALKKSETERQQQGGAEFATVPTGIARPRTPRWIWVLVALLVVNVAALLGLLLKADAPPAASASPVQEFAVTEAEVAPAAESSFEDRVAEARNNRPETEVAGSMESESPAVTRQPAPARTGVVRTDVPSMIELLANGTLQIPELHLDIHVFSHAPSERFVFINMNKQTEGSVLDEGPTVAEITVDGVVLEYQGKKFKLTRE
jgi:general secretion pathway protein B